MKKVIIAIILICFSLLGISQTYPTPYQSLGSINIAVRDTGGLMVRQTLVMPVYTDTTAANTMGYPKNYAGSQIFTSGNNKFWIRNFSKTAWINVGSGSGGSATWQDVLSNNPDLTTDNYPNLNYKAFQMSHVGTYSITNSTVSSSHESHIVMDSSDAEISNRDATLHLNNTTASLTGGNTELKIYNDSVTLSNQSVTAIDTVNTKPLVISPSGKLIKTYWFGGGGSTSSWSLTGNPLTTSANFIGTTDAQPLVFKVNNTEVGRFATDNKISFGSGSTASGSFSTAMGWGSTASGFAATAIGVSTVASGAYSTTIGYATKSKGYNSTAMNWNTLSKSYAGTVIGSYNDTTDATSATSYDLTNRVFQIGINDGSNPQGLNAMTVLFNGNVGIGTTTPTHLLHISAADSNVLRLQGLIEGLATDSMLTIDSDGRVHKRVISGGGSSITTFQVISDVDTTLTNVQASYLFKDISVSRTITLPASPTDGLEIQITSYHTNSESSSGVVLTIIQNAGQDIEGGTGGYIIEPKGTIKLKYYDSGASWAIINEKL